MMYEGYPFIFQMNDYSEIVHELHLYTMQYRFKSTKSNHKYIVRVECYEDHAYCVKFFDKANMLSDNKFSLRTGTYEARTIMFTVFRIMLDVLKRDPKASFFFIGAHDERDERDVPTRRFRVYKTFTLSVVSDKLFEHRDINEKSLYILINKESVADPAAYAERINQYVAEAYGEE